MVPLPEGMRYQFSHLASLRRCEATIFYKQIRLLATAPFVMLDHSFSWNVLEITSSCCSFVSLIKFTA